METNFKKKILTLGIICLVLLGMFLSLSFLGQRKVTKKGAFGTGATLRLVQTGTSHIMTDDTFIEVRMDTAEKVTMYQLALTYDKTKLQIVPMTTVSGFEPGPKFGFLDEMINAPESGNLSLRSGVPIPSTGANPANLPTGQNVLLARFKVRGLVAGTTRISFSTVNSTIINGFNPGSADVVIDVTTKTPVDLVFAGGASSFGTVDVKLDPATATRPANQEFNIDIKVDAGTQKVNLMKLGLNFDKNKMQIVSFTPGSWATADMFEPEHQDLGATTGTASLYAATLKSTLPSGVFTAGTITFNGKAEGINSITIDKARSEFGGEKGTQKGIFSVDQATNGSYTIGAGGSGSDIIINFKVKFRGVTAKAADQKLQLFLMKTDGTIVKQVDNINAVADDSGVYSASTGVSNINNNPPIAGTNYAIFIKGPKHLARKFCTNNQERFCAKPGTLTIVNGVNTFDFSKLVLDPGDLPDPNNANKQDGVANSVDISLVEARLNSRDADSLGVADVNFDGIVNQGDMSLVLNSIETRYEDDF